jgi:hypothetical protein
MAFIRYFSSILVCLLLWGAIPDFATAATVTFDGLSLGDKKTYGPDGKQLIIGGEIYFNAAGPGAGQMYVASPGAFGTSQLTSDYLTLYNQPGGVQIVFVNPISSFSANIGMLRNFGPEPTSDPKSLLFTAGTWGNNTVVEPINLPALYLMGGADWAAISFSFSTPVQVIQFFDPSWGLALDDVTYSVAQTPIPTALPLFGTGLGLMGLMGWWRKRRADMAG